MIKKIGKILLGISVLSMMNIDKVSASNEQLLSKSILGENNANVITSAPTFSDTSTDKGLFVQMGDATKSVDGKATYYYRGAVTNNYVNFADQIWRVVRINEDGSIRIISEDKIASVPYNPNGNPLYDFTSKYVNANKDEGESNTIKDVVEEWYNTNIGNNNTLNNKVVKSSFCNDISGLDDTDAYNKLGTAGNRMNNLDPTFICPSGSNKAYEKIGLITADEVLYAGTLIFKTVTDNPSYLTTGPNTWTMTPKALPEVYLLYSSSKFLFNIANTTIQSDVRGVINLDNKVMATGTGTKSDPYVISSKLYEEPKQESSKEETPKETYLKVKEDSNSAKEKIEKVVENNSIVYFEAEETNTFPGKANIDVSIKYGDGSKIWLYKYNKDTNKIEYVGNNINVIKGHAIVELSESGEYFFTANEIDSSLIGEQLGINLVYIIVFLSTILIGGFWAFRYAQEKSKTL